VSKLEKITKFCGKGLTSSFFVVELQISRRYVSFQFALIGESHAVEGNFSPFNGPLV